ncbi:MAG: acyltransferase [Acetobacteraceae bacterium]|nr:acyltransferase [Acetobacteraceae bacterium]
MSGRAEPAKLSGLEAGRGFAASAVVLYHAARHLDKVYGVPALMSLFQFGHAGVDFFFVISGFIILYVHYRDIGAPARLNHYIGRRFTRIMPTYWVALAITAMLALGGGHGLPSLADVLWSVSLLPSDHRLLLDIAWTLRFEMMFYAVFCLLILNRAVGLAVVALWLGVVLTAFLGHIAIPSVPSALYGAFNLEFFLGMAAAYVVTNYAVPAPKKLLLVGVALFAMTAAAEDLGFLVGYADTARLYYGIPAALIVVGVARAGQTGQLPVPSPLRILGSASYSVYLFQFVFIGLVWKLWLSAGLGRLQPHALVFLPLAAAGIVGGVLMSRYVEHPLIRMVRGRRRAIRPGAALG